MVAKKSEIPAHRYRALVVDDSQIARYILTGALSRQGFEVEVADSAESALRKLTGSLPDVVFLDQLLPGMNGLEAVDRLRAQPRTARLPVVMYTSEDGPDFAARALRRGADDVLAKTSDEARLAEILKKLELLPEEAHRPVNSVKALPTGAGAGTNDATRPNRAKITRADLARLLEPSLEAHHARLHKELLAEFAILERYEERMRRDLLARTDALMRHTTERIDQAFYEHRAENRDRHRRGKARGWALAATVLLGVALNLGAIHKLDERAGRLEAEGTRTDAALVAQARSVDALSMALLEARQAFLADKATSELTAMPAVAYEYVQPGGNVADALVDELQSMGILGPVRVETAAGSFCVTSAPGGFGIEASNLALEDCEPLPMQLSAIRH
jgi:CheY-like chemotaxis protein